MSEEAMQSADAAGHVEDRRRNPRLRSLLTGTIIFDNKCTMDCTVRNISAYGARVVLAEAFRMPETFNLRVPHHDQTHRATVVWRKGETAGLALADVEEHVRHRSQPRDAILVRQRMSAAVY